MPIEYNKVKEKKYIPAGLYLSAAMATSAYLSACCMSASCQEKTMPHYNKGKELHNLSTFTQPLPEITNFQGYSVLKPTKKKKNLQIMGFKEKYV